MIINNSMNYAKVKGGAICNSAFQGGVLYSTMPLLLVTTVGYQSSNTIQFINNTAFDLGPCVGPQCILNLYILVYS